MKLVVQLFLTAVVFLSGCVSPRYGYFPMGPEKETVSVNEHGATFPIKFGGGVGTLHAISYGIVDLKSSTTDLGYSALHLQMIIHYEKGTAPWTLDARDQKVQYSDAPAVIPFYAKIESEGSPALGIKPGETRRIDLFYPLPSDRQTKERINGFEFAGKLTDGKEVLLKDISFVRQPTHVVRKPIYVNAAIQHQNMVLDQEEMGPGFWWYNSMYPNNAMPGIPNYPPLK
jgi:hypothetical protein